ADERDLAPAEVIRDRRQQMNEPRVRQLGLVLLVAAHQPGELLEAFSSDAPLGVERADRHPLVMAADMDQAGIGRRPVRALRGGLGRLVARKDEPLAGADGAPAPEAAIQPAELFDRGVVLARDLTERLPGTDVRDA